eukprot:15577086-Heterocapsa_arctica.AAC.1
MEDEDQSKTQALRNLIDDHPHLLNGLIQHNRDPPPRPNLGGGGGGGGGGGPGDDGGRPPPGNDGNKPSGSAASAAGQHPHGYCKQAADYAKPPQPP